MDNVYLCNPINGTAARVTSQKGCTVELTPDQERESIVAHVKQIDERIKLLPKSSDKRKKLGLKKFELCEQIKVLNIKRKKIGVGPANRQDFIDCVFDVMKDQLSLFQYKQIMRLSEDLYREDLKKKDTVVTK